MCLCRISTDKNVIQNNIPCDSEKAANDLWVDKQQTRHGPLGFRQGETRQGHDRDRRAALKVPQGDILEGRLRDRRLAEVFKQFKGNPTGLKVKFW